MLTLSGHLDLPNIKFNNLYKCLLKIGFEYFKKNVVIDRERGLIVATKLYKKFRNH